LSVVTFTSAEAEAKEDNTKKIFWLKQSKRFTKTEVYKKFNIFKNICFKLIFKDVFSPLKTL
jgi:hypothetical protein